MKTAPQVSTHLRSAYNVKAVPKLIADWNLNRYYTPTAENTPTEDSSGFDTETFPISSITEPLRPTKGIIKALVNQAVAGSQYQKPEDPKFYVGDQDDVYKYWISPYTTNGSGVFPLQGDTITSARPQVTYTSAMNVNKIVIKLETTWATPEIHRVYTRSTVGGAWTQAGPNNPTINTDGTLVLYFNGSTWVSTRPATLVTAPVAGIQLRVDEMKGGTKRDGTATTYAKRALVGGKPIGALTTFLTDGSNSSLSVISIEPHLEVDLSNRLISVSDDFDMSESSQIYPIGTITSNQGDISLSNEDGIFNNENSSSPYFGLLEPNVEFNLEYIFTISGVDYSVQQFKLYGGIWQGQANDAISIQLEDYSKFLKETKPRQALYTNRPVAEIVWRVLDSVGFVDYEIQEDDRVVEHNVPYFWTNGEDTAWEILDELAKATQTAIYFDGYGKLQVRTREAAFRDLAAPDWTLYGQTVGANVEDIASLEFNEEYEANNVNVTYKSTKWKVAAGGVPGLSRVWEPDAEAVVVRSAPLRTNVTSGSTHIFLDQKTVLYWPFKSKVNIEGEVIQYEGKQFVYYTYTATTQGDGSVTYSSPVRNLVNVKDSDEMTKYNNMTPSAYRGQNRYTGGLLITEREVWNSPTFDHTVDANNWTTEMEILGKTTATMTTPSRGFKFNRDRSTVTLDTPARMTTANDTLWSRRGTVAGTGYKMYGTRLKFTGDKKTQRAGIGFCLNGSRNNGYYVEVCLSDSLTAEDRKTRNEVMIYSRFNGTWKVVGQGGAVGIGKNIFYDLDVYVNDSTQDTISVWINGQQIAKATTTGTTVQPTGNRFTMYARGKTTVEYEFIYAIARTITEPAEDFGFLDLKYGGVRGNLWHREFVWQVTTRWKKVRKKKQSKYRFTSADYLFDEFGPYVHEVREFQVKFDPAPVQYSTLFSTNKFYSAPLEYTSNPFGAEFIIANMSRNNAILHGEDSLRYSGTDYSVHQVLCVLGRNLEIADEETINKKNAAAIRARGQIDVEISSDWIQSKSMAETLATWIAEHWSEGLDELKVQIFGNPLIELGDIIAIEYDFLDMTTSTHKYFVTGVSNAFTAGIETTLTLRRIRTATI